MVRTPRDLLGHLYRPQKLQQQSNDISRRVHQIERAQMRIYIPLTFEEAKENEKKLPPKPKRAVTKRGHTPSVDSPPPDDSFFVQPWGPSWSYGAGGGFHTPGSPGSLGEIPEGGAVFAFYFVFDHGSLPSIESNNCDVTELLNSLETPVFWPSMVPQERGDTLVAHAVKATGPDAYFRYVFGSDPASGWGGLIANAGDITATDGTVEAAGHASDVSAVLALPHDADSIMMAVFHGDIAAFDGGDALDYPPYPADMELQILSGGGGDGFYFSNGSVGSGFSISWFKSGENQSGSVTNDGYLAAAGVVVHRP